MVLVLVLVLSLILRLVLSIVDCVTIGSAYIGAEKAKAANKAAILLGKLRAVFL